FEADIDTRGDFERRILKDVSAVAPPPRHDILVAHPQQRRDLRTEEPKHRTDPPVEHLRRLDLGDREPIEQADDIISTIPGFSSDPAIRREQADGLAAGVDSNCDEMAYFLPSTVLERCGLRWRWRHVGDRDFRKDKGCWSDRHPVGTQKSMKM